MSQKLVPIVGVTDDTTGQLVGVKPDQSAGDITVLGQMSADAIADTLEDAKVSDPASLTRIQGLVSGAAPRTAFNCAPQLVTVNNAENACYAQCFMVPGRYDAVRIGFVHAGGSGNVTAMAAACAATDDIGDRSNANTTTGRKFVSPLRAGVEKNAYQADGWQRLTVAGAASWDIAGGATVNDINIAWTDLCEVHGIESAAFPGYYPLLMRVYPGVTFTRPGMPGFTDPTKYLAEIGSKFMLGCYRLTSGGGGVPNDAVSIPANWSQTSNVAFGDSAVLAIVVEAYIGGVRHKTVIMSGDSRFHAAPPSLETTHAYRNTATGVDLALVAAGKKGMVLRAGQGARTTAQYYHRFDRLTEQTKPDYVAHVCYSINNGVLTAATADALLASARFYTLRLLDKCHALKATPILIPICPYGTGFEAGAARTAAFAFNGWCKSLGVPYVDMLALYGDAAGGWVAGTNEDANHGTWATYQAMAAQIAANIV